MYSILFEHKVVVFDKTNIHVVLLVIGSHENLKHSLCVGVAKL